MNEYVNPVITLVRRQVELAEMYLGMGPELANLKAARSQLIAARREIGAINAYLKEEINREKAHARREAANGPDAQAPKRVRRVNRSVSAVPKGDSGAGSA